jgi:hypothetical protein
MARPRKILAYYGPIDYGASKTFNFDDEEWTGLTFHIPVAHEAQPGLRLDIEHVCACVIGLAKVNRIGDAAASVALPPAGNARRAALERLVAASARQQSSVPMASSNSPPGRGRCLTICQSRRGHLLSRGRSWSGVSRRHFGGQVTSRALTSGDMNRGNGQLGSKISYGNSTTVCRLKSGGQPPAAKRLMLQ